MSFRPAPLAALLAAVAAAPAAAQTVVPAPVPVPVPVPVTPAASDAASDDPILASCLLIGGRAQSQICSFAKERLQGDELKGFVKAEIEQQEALAAKCGRLGYEYPAAAVPAGTPVVVGAEQLSVGRAVLSAGASRCVRLDKLVADKCAETFQMAAGKKSDAEFDQAFARMQLAAHHMLKDKLTVFRDRAGTDLRPVVAAELESCQADIRELEQCVSKLEQRSGHRSAAQADSAAGGRYADQAPPQTAEGLMAAGLLVDARKQQEICEAARGSARADAVQQFITAEIEQAKEFQAACRKVGYSYPSDGPDGTCQVGRVTLPPAAATAVDLDRRVAVKCVETFKANCDKVKGAEFDRAFVGTQLVAHAACKDKLAAFQEQAPADLRALLVGQMAACEADLRTLEGVMADLDRAAR